MMEPELLQAWETSELERRLLEAARHDRVPRELGARMAEGIGVQLTASIAPPSAGATGSALGMPLFAKVGLWGVLSVALVAAVASWQRASSAKDAPVAVARPPASVAALVTPPPAPAVAAAAEAVDPPAQPPTVRTSETAAHASAVRSATPGDDDALRAEIALLDDARNALREGASERALRLLDRHRRRFTRARLAPEAAALRIEALAQGGSHEQAESMARRFVGAYPSHPLSAQVSKLATTPSEPAAD